MEEAPETRNDPVKCPPNPATPLYPQPGIGDNSILRLFQRIHALATNQLINNG
jgi:hypothetical protein